MRMDTDIKGDKPMCECEYCNDLVQELLDVVSHSWNPFKWLLWKIKDWRHQRDKYAH